MVVAAAAAIVLMAGPAFGHTRQVATRITVETHQYPPECGLTYSPISPVYCNTGESTIRGVVNSRKPACIAKRRINVFRTEAGEWTLAGTAWTRRAGTFEVRVDDAVGTPAGQYLVEVLEKRIGRPDHPHTCRAVNSERVRF